MPVASTSLVIVRQLRVIAALLIAITALSVAIAGI